MKQLIVIEGLDGSGKATQAELLTANLIKQGKRAKQISFPDYESDSSALVKMYLRGEFGTHPDEVNAYAASSFFAVDRYASFKKTWEMDWKNGLIIADRYTTSNAIHQCSKLDRNNWDSYLKWLFHYEYQLLNIPQPNLVIYLHVDPHVSQELLSNRYGGLEKKKDIHERDIEYLDRCQIAADYCIQHLGWQKVECCKDNRIRPVSEIQDDIKRLTDRIL